MNNCNISILRPPIHQLTINRNAPCAWKWLMNPLQVCIDVIVSCPVPPLTIIPQKHATRFYDFMSNDNFVHYYHWLADVELRRGVSYRISSALSKVGHPLIFVRQKYIYIYINDAFTQGADNSPSLFLKIPSPNGFIVVDGKREALWKCNPHSRCFLWIWFCAIYFRLSVEGQKNITTRWKSLRLGNCLSSRFDSRATLTHLLNLYAGWRI